MKVFSFIRLTQFVRGAGAALLVSLIAHQASNAAIIIENAAQSGSQSNYLLGMDFVVNSSIRVTELGIFDADQDGFASTVEVGIFSISSLVKNPVSALLASTTFVGTEGTLEGGSRFKDITDIVLGPGTYSIVAVGFGLNNQSGNTGLGGTTSFNDLGGALSLVSKGGRWTAGATDLALPVANYGGYGQSDPVFQAGTFKAEVATVPDSGASMALLAFGLTALVTLRRKLF